MIWLSVAIQFMKLVNVIMNFVSHEQIKQEGKDELLAEQALILLQRTERGKRIMEKVDAMSEDDVDAEFARLARLRSQAHDN